MSSAPNPPTTNVEDIVRSFVHSQRELLEFEILADEENEGGDGHNDQGGGVPNMMIESVGAGLLGKTVVTLVPRNRGSGADDDEYRKPLVKVGDEVEILSSNKSSTSTKNRNNKSKSKSKKNSNSKNGGGDGGNDQGRNPVGVVCSTSSDGEISVVLFDRATEGAAAARRRHLRDDDSRRNCKGGTSKGGSSSGNGGGKKEEEDADDDNDPDAKMLGLSPPLTVIRRPAVGAYNAVLKNLEVLGKEGTNHPIAGKLIRSLFEPGYWDQRSPSRPCERKTDGFGDNDEGKSVLKPLDESQEEAIRFALDGEGPVALIHGPPGTGKTTAVAELVRRAVSRGLRVLVTAPSHAAVDNVLERILCLLRDEEVTGRNNKRKKQRNGTVPGVVRLGHPARLRPSLLRHGLESLVREADGTELVNDVRSELESVLKLLSNPRVRGSERYAAVRESRILRTEVRRRESDVVRDVLGKARIVFSTCVGAAGKVLNGIRKNKKDIGFDLVVIDEAAQALEASCWIPLLRGKRAILAGDHKQLPPTIKSNRHDVKRGLERTLFQRVVDMEERSGMPKKVGVLCRMLRVQYRMHANIAGWANNASYGGKLRDHPSVSTRRLSELPGITLSSNFNVNRDGKVDGENDSNNTSRYGPLLLLDTSGCDMHESEDGGSKKNVGEGVVVAAHVRDLVLRGIDAKDIAVISPYNGQVGLLRRLLLPSIPGLEIRSVDGFQGGEREAVVLSLVRSSEGGRNGLGFLRDARRLNVAVTRAKRHVAVICDCETVSHDPFLMGLVTYIEKMGEVRSCAEFCTEITPVSASVSSKDLIVTTVSTNDNHKNANTMVDVEFKGDRGIVVDGCSSFGINNQYSTPSHSSQIESVREHNRTNCNVDVKIKEGEVTEGDKFNDLHISKQCCNPLQSSERNPVSENSKENGVLADKLKLFADTAIAGEELDISLSGKVVACELSKDLGLGYREEKDKGIVFVKYDIAVENPFNSDPQSEEDSDNADNSGFAILVSDDESLDKVNEEEDDNHLGKSLANNSSTSVTMNTLLGSLAKEREIRSASVSGEIKKKKKNKKKKGKKLGKTNKTSQNDAETIREDHTLDDLAFLDTQIEKVQNSHGRNVGGSGTHYRSIINGILLEKPKSSEKKKDSRSSSVLNAKIKRSKESRKAKAKIKK